LRTTKKFKNKVSIALNYFMRDETLGLLEIMFLDIPKDPMETEEKRIYIS
jgi:hypothetical protein